MGKTKAINSDMLSRISCLINIYMEKKPDAGEDAYLFSVNKYAALVGAFDGCGGAGAKRYTKLQGKTGAYIASRTVCGSVREWFERCCEGKAALSEQSLKAAVLESLQRCEELSRERSQLRSPLVKTFPTTAAFAVVTQEADAYRLDIFWAGDSRVYLIDDSGLAQLSTDDLSVPDAMANLYDDGVMTNVISLSKGFEIHHRTCLLHGPAMILACTDGCFGYLSTPMEFEFMLLDTLANANSVSDYEQKLTDHLQDIAGDDFSMSALALDYSSFRELRTRSAKRAEHLERIYHIKRITSLTREEKEQMWDVYKTNYYRFQPEKD